MTNYTLIRSKRKTCAIHIINGTIEIRAPLRMKQVDIECFISKKSGWINKKLAESIVRSEQKSVFLLNYGDFVLYRGSEYIISAGESKRVYLGDEKVFYIPPDLSPENIKRACIQIYRLAAQNILTQKTLDFAKTVGVSPAAIKINSAASRWGSCSCNKNINYSWRLMMASDFVIDYVVVHELSHLIHMNHSAKFWSAVGSILPDYKKRQKELKELQKRLRTEDWR